MSPREYDVSTRAVHGGTSRAEGSPSAPPIVAASFLIHAGATEEMAYEYARNGNPTWDALESALGALEDASALVFASGQAATHALILALTAERPRLVLPADGYYGARTLAGMLEGRGVQPLPVDLADLDAVRAAVSEEPSVLWAETPTNPFLRVFDLEALGGIAAEAGAPLVVDNTVATAVFQQPLRFGAVASLISLTKISSGHSDLLLGAVTSRDESLLEQLRAWRSAAGGIAGPFEAWLAHRSLRTLPLRAHRQSETALALARHLAEHPRVLRVHYPGLDSATADVARRQMPDGYGPLLSFELDGSAAQAEAVVAASRLIRPGTSFGGVESSWERRARWAAEQAPDNLVRLSVGLEEPADLCADLDEALSSA